MKSIRGIFEIAIKVKDLERAQEFYKSVLGLEAGLLDKKRRWDFLRVAGSRGMVVLQEDTGEWPAQHFAFSVEAADTPAFQGCLMPQILHPNKETRSPKLSVELMAQGLPYCRMPS